MRTGKRTGSAALLLGAVLWAWAVSSPAEEAVKAQGGTVAVATASVEKTAKEKTQVYSPVLAVWKDPATGELRSSVIDPARPPVLAKK